MRLDVLVPLTMYCAVGFIVVCIMGFILKYFIREAIKEAFEEMGFYKRK